MRFYKGDIKKGIYKFRIFLWVALGLITAWLLYMGVVPGGKITYIYDFSKDNYFIRNLAPKERVLPVANGSQIIIGDPVYFSLRTPRTFDKGVLTLKYKNKSDLPFIEAGVLADKLVWNYELKPIENKTLDQLSLVWNIVQEGNITLLQRERKFNSLNDFLNNLPEKKEIALYSYDLQTDFIIADYKASSQEHKIDYAIRGSYQFYTYIKDEDLDFTFNFKDINKNKDSDNIYLNVYFKNNLIDSLFVEGDKIKEDNNKISELGEAHLKLTNLSEGLYKIEARTNDDIVTEGIKTKQSKLAFLNRIWLNDGSRLIKIYTDAREIKAHTVNPGSLQKIKVGDSFIELAETYEQFSARNYEEDINLVEMEKGDVILAGNGVFSFNEDSLINPEFRKVDSSIDINKEKINYVLADYSKKEKEGEWNVAQAEFNLKDAYREFYKYNFLISIPGLKTEDGTDDYLEIGEIKMDLAGTSLIEKIKRMIKND